MVLILETLNKKKFFFLVLDNWISTWFWNKSLIFHFILVRGPKKKRKKTRRKRHTEVILYFTEIFILFGHMFTDFISLFLNRVKKRKSGFLDKKVDFSLDFWICTKGLYWSVVKTFFPWFYLCRRIFSQY